MNGYVLPSKSTSFTIQLSRAMSQQLFIKDESSTIDLVL